MSYIRVIPRDLFNEAKLLKCLGQFALFHHNGKDNKGQPFPKSLSIWFDGDPFEVYQHNDDGALFCANFVVEHTDFVVSLFSQYNSKEHYPLQTYDQDSSVIDVFDDEGNFTKEFLESY